MCHGDSGGPLVINNVLVGVVAFGSECASGIPDGFMRLTNYTNWIDDIVIPKRKFKKSKI